MGYKKNVLLASFFYLTLIVGLTIYTCAQGSWCTDHSEAGTFLAIIAYFPAVIVIFFTLVTFKMHNDVFRAWRKFALWSVALLAVIYFLMFMPQSGGSGIGSAVAGSFAMFGLFLLYVSFAIISIIIIIRTYFTTRSGGKGK